MCLMSARRVRPERNRGSIYLGLAAGLFAASGAMVGGYVATEGPKPPEARSAAPAGSGSQAPSSGDVLASAVEQTLGQTVKVKANGQIRELRWSELGVAVDPDELPHAERKARRHSSGGCYDPPGRKW